MSVGEFLVLGIYLGLSAGATLSWGIHRDHGFGIAAALVMMTGAALCALGVIFGHG